MESRKPQPLLAGRPGAGQASFSPDGRWVAYRSSESGQPEVYVQPFPPSGAKWQISNHGGGEPRWRSDGKELYYASAQNPPQIMAVDIAEKNGAIQAGIPHALFAVRLGAGGRNRWVVARDGSKFLALVTPEQTPPTVLQVILNWPALLRRQQGRAAK